MDKDILQGYIDAGHSTRDIASIASMSQTTVRHWVKKHGLKTQFKTPSTDYFCPRCDEREPKKFYKSQRWLCKKCFNNYKKLMGHERRKDAVDQLGGKCCNPECNFDKFMCSLDIHHLDPKKKDPAFNGSFRYWSVDRIKREIENCVVLCKNCHSAVHAGLLIFKMPK